MDDLCLNARLWRTTRPQSVLDRSKHRPRGVHCGLLRGPFGTALLNRNSWCFRCPCDKAWREREERRQKGGHDHRFAFGPLFVLTSRLMINGCALTLLTRNVIMMTPRFINEE